VDMIVVTPDGKTVDARHPTTAWNGDEGPTPEQIRDPSIGRMDGDSLAECEPDGRNSESLTFREPARVPGPYNVYVNLFDACSHPSARFTLSVYRRQAIGEGTFSLALLERRSGVLLAPSANGGAGQPLYVATVSLP
jgi:hypothetical protein